MSDVSPQRESLRNARSLVIKVGTAVLTGGAKAIDRDYMHDLASHIAALRATGRRVLIVSSGAISAGVGALKLASRPKDVGALQAAAAAGQPLLMSMWREAFDVRGTPVAQMLLGRGDFDCRDRFLNIRNCVGALHELGAIPIVNENDTVATEEISLGDNDVLAAKVAVAVQADGLIILTTGPGVLGEHDRVVTDATDAESLKKFVRPARTTQGRGGMATKLEAARIASRIGVMTVIAPGRPADGLAKLLAGEAIGTCIAGAGAKHVGRRQWIALSATPLGTITVDDGAARALLERGASLLGKGVTGVNGRFDAGDVVSLRAPSGAEIARGLTNYSSDELRRIAGEGSADFEAILGRQVFTEVVHRDNLALTSSETADA